MGSTAKRELMARRMTDAIPVGSSEISSVTTPSRYSIRKTVTQASPSKPLCRNRCACRLSRDARTIVRETDLRHVRAHRGANLRRRQRGTFHASSLQAEGLFAVRDQGRHSVEDLKRASVCSEGNRVYHFRCTVDKCLQSPIFF